MNVSAKQTGKQAVNSSQTVISAQDLSLTFQTNDGPVHALKDVTLDIGQLVRSLAAERICTPVIACGIGTDARRAVDAIRADAMVGRRPGADRHELARLLHRGAADVLALRRAYVERPIGVHDA